jgi:hypothetical protein
MEMNKHLAGVIAIIVIYQLFIRPFLPKIGGK